MAVPIGFEPMASAFGGREKCLKFNHLYIFRLTYHPQRWSQRALTENNSLWAPFEHAKGYQIMLIEQV